MINIKPTKFSIILCMLFQTSVTGWSLSLSHPLFQALFRYPKSSAITTTTTTAAMTTSSFSSSSTTKKQQQPKNAMLPMVVILAGPTAVGKSDVAARLCANNRRKGMIVSADSVQAYQGVQIGANKPTLAEREATPHMLIDIVANSQTTYNAAEWRRDAIYTINKIVTKKSNGQDDEEKDPLTEDYQFEEQTAEEKDRQRQIDIEIQQAQKVKNMSSEHDSVVPVVVGGTMMYLQWLVRGRPDALRPSEDALHKALATITQYQQEEENDHDGDCWQKAVQHVVETMGEPFAQQALKLFANDWYRLRRILEVAYTAQEKDDDSIVEKLYNGQRKGGLSTLGYDVRCFFLCPTDRMYHTKVIDERCEQMLLRGLLEETTDLSLSGQLPDMAAKAIGYRQTLEYLKRENAKDDDETSFQSYLEEFTTATRRYGKRQMQWFRKDKEFIFIPVSLEQDKEVRTTAAATEIEKLLDLSREDYERAREDDNSMSAQTRQRNEAQGKRMKTYQFESVHLKEGTPESVKLLQRADACTNRLQSKRSRRDDVAVVGS